MAAPTAGLADYSVDLFGGPDGSKYYGTLKCGLPEGLGTCIWPDGSQYDGEWRNGRMHGFGTYVWRNGQRYDGEFRVRRRCPAACCVALAQLGAVGSRLQVPATLQGRRAAASPWRRRAHDACRPAAVCRRGAATASESKRTGMAQCMTASGGTTKSMGWACSGAAVCLCSAAAAERG